MNVTEAYVDSLALNAGAIKNGRDLAKKNSYPLLCVSEDGTVLFGECKGSGKEPYRCSADFANEASPVFRCSCPSRQFPCKHILGLMYAYAGGKPFQTAPIPTELAEKREKAEKREEKKREAAATNAEPAAKRKPNKAALTKKIKAQLEGVAIAEKLVLHMAQSGLGTLDKKELQTAADQAKQLGGYYIPGIQAAVRELLERLQADDDREAMYDQAIGQLLLLHALLKKSRSYLQTKLDDPDAPIDTESTLEEQIGHAWQLAELREHGLALGQQELIQLAFHSYLDKARGEYVDEGFWITVGGGDIYAARTYRPVRAAKHMKEEDSFFQIVQAKELVRYPGELNPRARWDEATFREPEAGDYAAVRTHAIRSVADAVKRVKNQIKNPLSDKHPVLLLHAAELSALEGGGFALVDEQGGRLQLADLPQLLDATTHLLPLLDQSLLRDTAVLLMFGHDMAGNRLAAQPLSLVGQERVVRLLY